MQKLLTIASISFVLKSFQEDLIFTTSGQASASKSARENLISEISRNPFSAPPDLNTPMAKFISENKLNIDEDYDLKSFINAVMAADPEALESHAETIYLYFCNYVMHARRIRALEALKSVSDKPSSSLSKIAMQYLLARFYIDNLDLSEAGLKTQILKIESTLPEAAIPRNLHLKYVEYANYIKMKEARDRLLATIDKIPITEIERFEDSMTKFIKYFEIKKHLTYMKLKVLTKEQLKEYLILKFPEFEKPIGNFDKIWPIYEKYNIFKNCEESLGFVISVYDNEQNPYYFTTRGAMKDFKTSCGLKENYDDFSTLWDDLKKLIPSTEKSQTKVLFDYYKKFTSLYKREITKNKLIEEIENQENDPNIDIESYIEEFGKVFDLPLETIEIVDLNPMLNEIIISPSEVVDGTKILTKYNEYVTSLNFRKIVENILRKKGENPNIKIFELKKDMDDFLKISKLVLTQKYSSSDDFYEYMQKIDRKFSKSDSNIIENKYKLYLEYLKREESRRRLLNLIRTLSVFSIRMNADELSIFKSLHFPTDDSYQELEDFVQNLKENDGVDEFDSELIHPFYLNYLSYIKKENNRKQLLKKHREDENAHIYTLNDLVKEFVKTHYFDPEKIYSKKDFNKYLDDQDLEISEIDRKILYQRYIEYLKYSKLVENKIKLFKMILAGLKMSEMKTTIDEFVINFKLIKEIAINEREFKSHLTYIDPSINEVDIPDLNQIIIEYFKLIDRILTKEKLLEFISLNPKPLSKDLESFIMPFIINFDLKKLSFSKLVDFYTHLQEQQDDISREESEVLFKYWQIFAKIENRWNSKNNLIELLNRDLQPEISQLFPLVEVFVAAYELEKYKSFKMNEFKNIVELKDDNFEEEYIQKIYDSVIKYLEFLERVQAKNVLLDVKKLRTEATIFKLEHYVNKVIKLYLIDHDLLSDFDKFTQHVTELDYTITSQQIDSLYDILLNHVSIIERINIKEAALDMIKICSKNNRQHINNIMAFLANSYELIPNKIIDYKTFYEETSKKDPSMTLNEATRLYPHYLKYIDTSKSQNIRASLVDFIKKHPKPDFDDLSKYVKPYIEFNKFLLQELYKYERFYLKNKEIDSDISDLEIAMIWEAIQIFLRNGDYLEKQILLLVSRDIANDVDFIRHHSIRTFYYRFFKLFGAYPHFLPKGVKLRDLSDYQQSFRSTYKYLTGVEYFRTRPNEHLSEDTISEEVCTAEA